MLGASVDAEGQGMSKGRICEECNHLVDHSSKTEDPDTRICFCKEIGLARFAGNTACEKFKVKE